MQTILVIVAILGRQDLDERTYRRDGTGHDRQMVSQNRVVVARTPRRDQVVSAPRQ